MTQIHGICPVLPVADIHRSKEYYATSLGFEIGFEWFEEDGSLGYLIVRRDDHSIHISQVDEDRKDKVTPSITYIFVEPVEEMYDFAHQNGAIIKQELQEWPWGMKEFEVHDPDGHRFIFGHAVEQDEESAG